MVGAGIGGLSTALALAQAGHPVQVFESASVLAEVGAGIQLTPNATKWFWRWGLDQDLLAHSAIPVSFDIWRDDDGTIIRSVDFTTFKKEYGAPYIVVHRADLHRVLHEHAVRAGAKIRLNSRVVAYEFERGSITLRDGETISADLVIAMDGVNSEARQALLHKTVRGLGETGWAAYRVMAPVSALKADVRTADLVSRHACNCWSGDQKCVMTYMVKGAQWLNIVFSHCNDVDTRDWTSDQYQSELRKQYGNWNSTIQALLEHASTKIENWPVNPTSNLPRWSSESGKFVLAGDAAHSMAFYLSMGVSMAVEDAAALAECLRLYKAEQLPLAEAIQLFGTLRKERAEAVRDASLHAGQVLQRAPGPLRDDRDEAMRSDGRSASTGYGDPILNRNSYGIADELIRDWCYSYDVVEAVRAAFDQRTEVQKSRI